MPSQCRADDGTEHVGRYDRRMEQWIPLFGVGVTALATVGVAFWNSRGQSKDLARLKGMNDVLADLPAGSTARQVFEEARDALAVRVATRIAAAPRRARLLWRALLVIVGVAAVVAGAWLLSPFVAENIVEGLNILATGVLTLAVAGLAWAMYSAASTRQLKKQQEDIEAVMRIWNEARLRAMERRIDDPGGGRSA